MLKSTVTGIALLGIAACVQADRATLNGGLGYGGGSFTAVIQREAGSPFGVGPNISVTTFCVESQSYFSPGTTYFAEYSTSTSGVNGVDPISSATAWLFATSIQGTLTWDLGSGNVLFDINNQSHNKAVQSALWSLEDEAQPFSLTTAQQNIRANILAQANAAAALANGSLFGVRVMRLWDNRSGSAGNYSFSGDRQDQLVLIPLPSAAWAGISMMAGVLGMAYIRRRKQQAD